MHPASAILAWLLAVTAPGAEGGDPTAVQQLSPPAAQSGGRFGETVAVAPEHLLIGAPGVDGAAPASGVVYVYGSVGGLPPWTLTATLAPASGASGDGFGAALAADGRLAAVAAPGVAVHLFELGDGGSWCELQRIPPGDDALEHGFGSDLALSGDLLLVGAPERGQGAGAAYLFERVERVERVEGGRFELREVLLPSFPQAGARFGQRLALDGGLAAISAPGHRVPDAPAGQQSVGAAYLFARTGAGAFTQLQLLAPGYPAPIEEYGADLDLDARTVVVGAPRRDFPGLNGAGAALLLEPDSRAGAWVPVCELTAGNAQADDGFGAAVAVRGDVVLIGAPDTAFGGAVYAFGRDCGGPGAWGQFGQVDNPTGLGDFFGAALGLHNGRGLVGAPAADAGQLGAAGAATVIEGLGGGSTESHNKPPIGSRR